jgi:hypothetical protein
MPPEYFSQQATQIKATIDDAGLDIDIGTYFASENFSTHGARGIDKAPMLQLRNSPWSLEPVKIALRWRIFNDMAACQK